MRSIHSDTLTQLAAGTLRPFHLIDMEIDSAHYRYTDCDVPIIYDGNSYTPTGCSAADASYDIDSVVDTVKVSIANLNEAMSALFVGSTPQGSDVIIYYATVDAAGTIIGTPVTHFQGVVDSWNLDEEKLDITISNELVQWNQNTLRKHSPLCPWKVFGGTECGYSGEETWCDRTYRRCSVLSNTDNFGGFRWLPSLQGKKLFWGGDYIEISSDAAEKKLPIIYGQRKIEGNLVYAGVDDADLWMVFTLAEGECDSIEQVGGVDQVFIDGELYNTYGGNIAYYFHSGASDQVVDSNLSSAIGAWTDCLRNTCYIVVKVTYDEDYILSPPSSVEVVLGGKQLYDFRDTSTAYSNNIALAMYDYMTNTRYGLGLAAAKLDTTTSWDTSADYCDTKSWGLNWVIDGDKKAGDILKTMRRHFRADLTWWDGKFYLRHRDLSEESPAMTITDEHIARNSSGKALISISQDSLYDRPDGIEVTWKDPDNDYTSSSFIVGEASGVIDSLDLPGCTSRQMAADLGVYELERKQLSRQITGQFRGDTLQLEPHDIVTLTTSSLGISDQTMRVVKSKGRDDGDVSLTLIYESTYLYDQVYNIDTDEVYTCSLPNPKTEPPSVGNVIVTEVTEDYRLRTFTTLRITFDEPPDYNWFSHVEVWLSYDDSTWEHQFNTNNDFEIPNVIEGKIYYVRLKVVNIWGVKQQDTNDYKISRTILGHTAAPTSLGALQVIVNQNSVNLFSDKVSDSDVELYEFRLGSSWSGGIFLSALRSPNLSLVGVKPGTHTFFANTLSNNGVYGSTPRSATVTLPDPPDGWAVQDTDACDYNAVGTHDNTEHTTYSSDDYLKCSHTAGVLTGTYLSPIYDLGASGRYLVYCQADIVVTGAGTTWGDVAPSPDTWADIGASSITWGGLTSLDAGPTVQMTLKYGDTSPPTSEVGRQEILSAIVTGRYYQMEITITDPTDAVNCLVGDFTLKYCQ